MELKEIVQRIMPVLEPYGIKRIAIFGSVARGEAKKESDIDVLVEFEKSRKAPLGLLTWIGLERDDRFILEGILASIRQIENYAQDISFEDFVVV